MGSASNGIALTEWQQKRVDESLAQLLPVVTSGMTSAETAEARRVYSDLLRVEILAFGTHPEISSELFGEMVSERLQATAGRGLEERRQQVRGDALQARVLTIDRRVVEASEQAARGGEVPSAAKARVREDRDELKSLAERLERDHPALHAAMNDRISEALLDCTYVLDGGDPASLRLNQFVESLPR